MNLDVSFSKVSRSRLDLAALCCESINTTRCADGTIRTGEPLRPRSLRDLMLKILSRDNELRRMVLQRRWQGLDE
jgi:hypothetical protein